MATITLTEAEAALHPAVGTRLLLAARILLAEGRVELVEISPDGPVRARVTDGPDRTRHEVRLDAAGPGGEPDLATADCTCGSRPCGHVVAVHLMVAGTPAGAGAPGTTGIPAELRTRTRAQERQKPVSAWESTLRAALTPPPPPRPTRYSRTGQIREARERDRPEVAVQFEVPHPGSGPDRIGLRLVSKGSSGAWVRSGVSWMSLTYAHYHLRGVPTGQVRLLQELHGLPTTRERGYGERVVHLDDITSRRVWDLLAELQDAGMPLVTAGRRAGPVHVHRALARSRLHLRRDGADLLAEPLLHVADRPITGHRLVGEPPHGIAWSPDGPAELHLAALDAPPHPVFDRLVVAGPQRIPGTEQDRFLGAYYPQLAEHVEVTCPDGSVPLPQSQPPVPELSVTGLGGDRLRLDWTWLYRLGNTVRRVPFTAPAGWGPGDRTATARDLPAEEAALARLSPLLAELPDVHDITAPAAAPGTARGTTPGTAPAAGTELDGVVSARFVSRVLPRLRESGQVEVRIVETAEPLPDYREAEDAPVVTFAADSPDGGDTGPGGPGSTDWFDLAVTVTVDGHRIPFNALFVALAREQTHLLLDNGVWFSLDHPHLAELARVIAESRELLDAPPGTVRVSRFTPGLWEDVERLGTVTGELDGWRRQVRALLDGPGRSAAPLPAGLRAELRGYQEAGFTRLATWFGHGLGGILADDMGLGKTLQTLALVVHARESAPDGAPFLVVAPTSVVSNWAEQAARFAPDLTVTTVERTAARRESGLADLHAGADLVITSYTLFRLEFDGYRELPWSGLILDEAQNVKNRNSAGYRCARQLPVGFKLAITGTPMENNLMELWALLSLAAPGLFPRPDRFTEYYRTPIERSRDPERLDLLRRRIRPLVLRRTKDQVAADLPERQEQVLELTLNPQHRAVYQRHLQRERQKVLGLLDDLDRNRIAILRSLTLLRQASIDPALVDGGRGNAPSTKLEALREHLDDIVAEGHRVLVFSQFTRFLTRGADRLGQAGVRYRYLDGKTRNRAEVITGFRTGDDPVFLISLKAGGTGLTLTEADYVILLDPWWNPAVEAQAVDRTHRIGQTRNVMVYRMVARDTIEEKVMALKERKAELTSSVLDGGDLASAALTAEDIRALLD
ncbi:MAG: DEAD/DEAH box helicase [Kineosporiaceae bacterium]